MQDDDMNKVISDLFSIPSYSSRIVRSKFTKVALADVKVSITPLHFEIMCLLSEEGSLPVAEIGKKLVLAKAHMTQLIDKLVEEKIVSRKPDPNDRRITRVFLTENGRKSLGKFHERVSSALEKALSALSENDLRELSDSLSKIRNILSKMV